LQQAAEERAAGQAYTHYGENASPGCAPQRELCPDEICTQYGNQSNRQYRRTGHRKCFGKRQRMKQLSSCPISEKTGIKARMMIAIEKKTGRPNEFG
jgi:hypothetical protein